MHKALSFITVTVQISLFATYNYFISNIRAIAQLYQM